jgi:serine phosphatase RsbU (regulator of sigma subunit)/outer membrane biosynthesis protein TonB
VSPFQSLRRETRAGAVRSLAGLAVFCTLAIVLIAITAVGSAASPEATGNGSPAQGGDPAVTPEPVLGAETAAPAAAPEVAPPPAAQPAPAAAAEPPPVEPAPAEAPAEQPAAAPVSESPDPVERQAPELRGAVPPEESDDESPQDEEKGRGEENSGEMPDRGSSGDYESGGDEESDGDQRVIGEEPPGGKKPIEEPSEDDESGYGEEPDRGEGDGNRWWGDEPPARVRRPNLSGALGVLGGGGKDESSIGRVPGLGLPGGGSSVAVVAPPEPDFDEPPTRAASTPAPSQPAGGPPPVAPPPAAPPLDPIDIPATQADGRSLRRDSTQGDMLIGEEGSIGGGSSSDGTAGTIPAGTGTATGTGADVAEGFLPAPAVSGDAFTDQIGQSEGGGDGSADPVDQRRPDDEPGKGVASIVRKPLRVANNVPDALKYALAALGALAIMLGVGYFLAAMRARSLSRQRRELLQEVGLLQSALLPPVPEKLGSLRTSVAYRPADGPGAGGDFYDVLPLAGGSVGFILGDVSGHGRGALARTAFMRYTLRAYLEAGLEPRAALQVAGRVIDENLGGDFATVLLAVHDPETGSLTYATAGHPAPIVVGPETHHPVTAGSSPPIGVGVPTGLRQTTVPLVPGAIACLFTDGLMDARVAGGILGRGRLEELLLELGDDATARGLIERVSQESRVLSDDIAAVVVSPANGAAPTGFRTEQLELSSRELEGPIAHRFLESCGVSGVEADAAVAKARALAGASGAVILDVMFGENLRVDVRPRDAESIEAASRRAAAR